MTTTTRRDIVAGIGAAATVAATTTAIIAPTLAAPAGPDPIGSKIDQEASSAFRITTREGPDLLIIAGALPSETSSLIGVAEGVQAAARVVLHFLNEPRILRNTDAFGFLERLHELLGFLEEAVVDRLRDSTPEMLSDRIRRVEALIGFAAGEEAAVFGRLAAELAELQEAQRGTFRLLQKLVGPDVVSRDAQGPIQPPLARAVGGA
jgi:hypothetical protein